MESHAGTVIGAMRLHALYIADVNGPPVDRDALLGWVLSSPDYWSVLAQYGVGYGTLGGSSTIGVATFFGLVPTGKVGYADVAAAVANVATLPPDEGGAPNAFIVFLPGTADVDFGDGNCGSTLGYHSYVDTTAYAVIRPCGEGGVTISHELAEMATDPIPYAGWYSEDDQANGGGEVGDLCNFPAIVDGYTVTALWSNADGQCEPL